MLIHFVGLAHNTRASGVGVVTYIENNQYQSIIRNDDWK